MTTKKDLKAIEARLIAARALRPLSETDAALLIHVCYSLALLAAADRGDVYCDDGRC